MNRAPRTQPLIAWWWIVIVGFLVPIILTLAEESSVEKYPDFLGIAHMAMLTEWTLLTLLCVVVVVALRLFNVRAWILAGVAVAGLLLQLSAAMYFGYVLLVTPRFPTTGKLFTRAAKGDTEYVKKALEWGIDPVYHDSHSSHTSSVLAVAAKYGHNEIVTLLLDHGTDPNLDLGASESPLMQALWSGNIETARLLISRGADPKKVYDSGNALHALATTDKTEFVQDLIAAGCDVNSQPDYHSWTPLHRASMVPQPRMMKLLVEKGAKPSQPDSDGATAIDLAERRLRQLYNYRNLPPPGPHQSARPPGPSEADLTELQEAIEFLKVAAARKPPAVSEPVKSRSDQPPRRSDARQERVLLPICLAAWW